MPEAYIASAKRFVVFVIPNSFRDLIVEMLKQVQHDTVLNLSFCFAFTIYPHEHIASRPIRRSMMAVIRRIPKTVGKCLAFMFHTGYLEVYTETRSFSTLLRSTAFVATIIDDTLIKMAEISGLSEILNAGYKTPAATGIASRL